MVHPDQSRAARRFFSEKLPAALVTVTSTAYKQVTIFRGVMP
jgi:hypothetical protein